MHFIYPKDIDNYPGFLKGRVPHTKETKEKLSVSQRKKKAMKAHQKTGKDMVTKYKNRKKKGEILLNEGRAKKVICIENNKIFNSIKEARL